MIIQENLENVEKKTLLQSFQPRQSLLIELITVNRVVYFHLVSFICLVFIFSSYCHTIESYLFRVLFCLIL